jgi:hypothetical protein
MGKMCSLLGWSIFLFVLVGFAAQYGKRWEFGPHGFNTLVAEDGQNYRGDGTAIDPITLALHRSGHDGACLWALLGVIGAALAYVAYAVGSSHRQLAKLDESFRQLCEQEQGNSPRD